MAASWRIIAQTQREDFGDGGKFIKVWDVTYETDTAVRGTITVPERFYTEDYVRSEIESLVARNIAIGNL